VRANAKMREPCSRGRSSNLGVRGAETSFVGRKRHGLDKCELTPMDSRGSRALVFVRKIKLEELRSMRLKRLPQRHAARSSRSGAERAGGGGEGHGASSPVPRVYFFRGNLVRHGVHATWAPGPTAVSENQGPPARSADRGDALRVDRVPQSSGGTAPRRPHGGGRILSTCTFSRLRGRAACCGPRPPPTGARLVFSVQGLGPGFFMTNCVQRVAWPLTPSLSYNGMPL
jgi:hypothetical protein